MKTKMRVCPNCGSTEYLAEKSDTTDGTLVKFICLRCGHTYYDR